MKQQQTASLKTLPEWLAWLERLQPEKITLGLERVAAVGQRLGVLSPAARVISIAGTNGKGSCAALLEATLLQAGLKIAVYSSPHLLRYNERLRINGREVADDQLCQAFAQVADKQADVPLSYFEFGTLAVLTVIKALDIDVVILEVGLGGRLDAVNAVDADIALITNIGLDHRDWLGDDREQIGAEKAGIMRGGRPVICNDIQPPQSIAENARRRGAELFLLNREYAYRQDAGSWHWQGMGKAFADLPLPIMAGAHQIENAAAVLAVMTQPQLAARWQISHFHRALQTTRLAGRCDSRSDPGFGLILDVAHNSEAAAALASLLRQQSVTGRTVALFAALEDKPVAEMLERLRPYVDSWYVAGLGHLPRGMELGKLRNLARTTGIETRDFPTVPAAWLALCRDLAENDRAVVFGSFHTVEAVMKQINAKETGNG